MIKNHAQFLDAIREKKLVRVEFYSLPDEGTIDRECAPLDYGPELGTADVLNRYWIWDYANATGANPLGLLPDQIVGMSVLGKGFDVAALQLEARPWFVLRDWGAHPELQVGPPAAASEKVK
jgi:hypothetical protein